MVVIEPNVLAHQSALLQVWKHVCFPVSITVDHHCI
jgi:hypothetical protein